MSLISWNVRGLGNPRAFDKLRMLIRDTSPSLAFLMETRLRSKAAESVKRRCGFHGGFYVDCSGRSGGLMLMWKEEVEVHIQSYSQSHIDCHVRFPHGVWWRFTGFYGNPSRSDRHHSWTLLLRLKSLSNLPWVVAGDFNEILFLSKKEGGNNRYYPSMNQFRDTVESCDLVDLGFVGPKFTWDNGQEGGAHIRERLDRALGCDEWINLFPYYGVRNMDFYDSDHRALWLELVRDRNRAGRGPKKRKWFRFEPFWMTDEDFKDTLRTSWGTTGSVGDCDGFGRKLQSCGRDLSGWSRVKFGRITRRVRNLHEEIERIRNASALGYNRRRLWEW
ncbi:uncharacterized protein LOC112091706 [Morus notabilis]|uniref:uncharacterized protein LOC112091706 n=1 Tax=Morus notabilis TaxID=981085 RepID=UPI000CED7C68|nr:uncharacterized protein LOC112091706 [Morus notabilis]